MINTKDTSIRSECIRMLECMGMGTGERVLTRNCGELPYGHSTPETSRREAFGSIT